MKLGKSCKTCAADGGGDCSAFGETPVGTPWSQAVADWACTALAEPSQQEVPAAELWLSKGEQCWTHLGTAGKKGAATSPALPWAFQTPQQLLSRAQSLGSEELPVSAPKHRVSREGWEGNLFRLTLGSFLVCLLLRFSSVGYSSFLPTHWH